MSSSSDNTALDMKDVTVSSSKSSRSTAYPKKRPSPHGIYKTRKQQQQASSPNVPSAVACRSPHALKMQREQQRQRDQIVAHAAVTLCREAPQMEDEYRDEIQNYMYQMERYTMGSTSSMDQQPEIKWHMRPCLVEFLLELHFTFRLRPETLYLTLNVLDRYVSRRVVYIKHYQLVGCAALWIAAKFEDAKDRVPSVSELVHYCRNEYDESAFIQMEGHVLQTIQWSLGHPTAEAWLRIYCRSPRSEEMQVQHVARFLMEITLFYRAFIKFPASSIALGSLMLARFLCGKPRRVFEETEEAFDVVEALDLQLSKHVEDLSEILVKKYSYAFFSKAATLVVRFYIEGGHFVRAKSTVTPLTPSRTSMSAFGTPMSATTTASDLSDEMPQTPTSPAYSIDSFACAADDKENATKTFEPVVNKVNDNPPEKYLPHEFVTISRPVLHPYNAAASPRSSMVV